MSLVAGVDSSTQSCKVVIRDVDTGEVVRSGRADHPQGTEVNPSHWWTALQQAVDAAGGLSDVDAISVAGQQHGMVCLDGDGQVVRDALLWNDLRSAPAAAELVTELGQGDPARGAVAWADAVGSVPVASLTVAKLRWFATHEPDLAARTEAVCLPHDWLSWQLAGGGDLDTLWTDRSDASGTGYWSPAGEAYRPELLELAFGRQLHLPRVLAPNEVGGQTPAGKPIGPGAGDNAGAALGLGMRSGDVTISIGTSGVVSASSDRPTADASGLVAGFADAAGNYLPLACTLNGARIVQSTAQMLGVDFATFDRLALSAPAGCNGLVMVPYLEGERTPNLPGATGRLVGLRPQTMTPAHLARAAVEGLLCLLADALAALTDQGIPVQRISLIGGGAKSAAVRELAPSVLGWDVHVPAAGEYVADGAAAQAAWVHGGQLASWPRASTAFSGRELPAIREQYAAARDALIAMN